MCLLVIEKMMARETASLSGGPLFSTVLSYLKSVLFDSSCHLLLAWRPSVVERRGSGKPNILAMARA